MFANANRRLWSDGLPEHRLQAHCKETCRNWLFKIASIRELIPRLYIEIAVVKLYSFLDSAEYEPAIGRLSRITRGIGDLLVAAYARSYLCRVGITVNTEVAPHLLSSFSDLYHTSSKQLKTEPIKAQLESENITLAQYVDLCNS